MKWFFNLFKKKEKSVDFGKSSKCTDINSEQAIGRGTRKNSNEETAKEVIASTYMNNMLNNNTGF
jgi:hypothetical protein